MTSSEHERLLHGLNAIHSALRRSLASIVRTAEGPISDADRAAFVDFTERFARFLHVHHDGEEEIVFPMLGRASSPEAKKLVDGWKGDHATLIPKLRAMESACADFARGGAREPLAQAAKAVQDFLVPHLDAEESALDTATLAKLVTAEEATALALASSKHGQRVGGSRRTDAHPSLADGRRATLPFLRHALVRAQAPRRAALEAQLPPLRQVRPQSGDRPLT
jgi:hemerythrin-like domain-containing protein